MKRAIRPIAMFVFSAVVVFIAAKMPEAMTKQHQVRSVASIRTTTAMNDLLSGTYAEESVAGSGISF